jgi:hypothetical protein
MPKAPTVVKVTFWHFLRDVFIASINKGQFPVAILGLILAIYCLRVSPDVLAQHGREILQGLAQSYLIGYALFIGIVPIWYAHTRSLRKKHYLELKRIAEEKTEVQKSKLGSKIKSSKNS